MISAEYLIEKLNTDFNKSLKLSTDGQAIYVLNKDILEFLKKLQEKFSLTFLVDITAINNTDGFEVIYHLMSLGDATIIRVKTILQKENLSVPSITSLWKSANVMEREVFDLMGITFSDHPNLKRILCPDDFSGHPLRKDFTLDAIDRFV